MNLRQRLREELRPEHDRLDLAVSRYDLREADDYAAFLQLQERSLSRIDHSGLSPDVRGALERLVQSARDDLSTLGKRPDESDTGPSITAVALAVEYIIGGSQLGNSVLKQRWAASEDDRVRAASAFFGGVHDRGVWRSFLATAENMPGAGARSDTVVADARRLFESFSGNVIHFPPRAQADA